MHQSLIQRALQAALALVCAATLAYDATGVDWSYAYQSKSLLGAIFVFCFAGMLGLAPYVLLWQLLRFNSPNWLKPFAFALIVAPAPILFVVWRYTEGWSFFLVPVVQFLIALALFLLATRLKQHPRVPT
jgi:hypothetical protein